uniref:Uncharacterized protein n=1 Tax=Arundo donax TaxID=35708 RepID=A0A0A9A811_ARUDO
MQNNRFTLGVLWFLQSVRVS